MNEQQYHSVSHTEGDQTNALGDPRCGKASGDWLRDLLCATLIIPYKLENGAARKR